MAKVGTAFEEPEGDDEAPKKFVPVWQQDVRDEEGRRRFHGAWTGGFSAGYYNTVGSKEGWTPSTFTSSRSQRAERVVSAPQQFMDNEDYEAAGVGGRALSSRKEYDVFASQAPSSIASSQSGEGAAAHSSVLASMLAPPRDSIGSKLLKLMGWREGRRIGPRKTPLAPPPVVSAAALSSETPAKKVYGVSLIDDIRQEQEDEQGEEERYAERMKEETPVQVLSFRQKSDTFGIGFDPHSAAPELRELAMRRDAEKEAHGKTQRPVLAMAAALQTGKGVPVPQRFGLGALEKGEGAWSAEAYDNAEIAYDREINDPMDDDAIHHYRIRKQPSASQHAVNQLMPDSVMVAPPKEAQKGRDGRAPLRRFRIAEKASSSLAVRSFNTPPMPATYVPHHIIAKPRGEATRSTNASARATLLGETALADQSAPPPVVRGGLLSAADRDRLLVQATAGGASDAKRAAEMARIGGVMASRFVTSGSSFSSTATVTADGKTGRIESAAEAAARSGMYGKFTRTEERWRPEKLLCKRWNVRDPWHGRDDAPKTDKEKQAAALAELISAAESTAANVAAQQQALASVDMANSSVAMQAEEAERHGDGTLQTPEAARPSIDLFKAIFADDDDDAPPLLSPLLPTEAKNAAAPSSSAPAAAAAAPAIASAASQGSVPPHASTTKRPRASDFM